MELEYIQTTHLRLEEIALEYTTNHDREKMILSLHSLFPGKSMGFIVDEIDRIRIANNLKEISEEKDVIKKIRPYVHALVSMKEEIKPLIEMVVDIVKSRLGGIDLVKNRLIGDLKR